MREVLVEAYRKAPGWEGEEELFRACRDQSNNCVLLVLHKRAALAKPCT